MHNSKALSINRKFLEREAELGAHILEANEHSRAADAKWNATVNNTRMMAASSMMCQPTSQWALPANQSNTRM